MPDDELSKTIDAILEENDLDKDGFIDYAEFVKNQRAEESNAV
jgi:Ca2+-binding EF-hand superfamily protein